MKPKYISMILASLLWTQSLWCAAEGLPQSGAPTSAETNLTVKERILEIPPGTLVQVRLLTREKLKGRLGEITDEGFALQMAKSDKIETRQVAFSEVKSIKKLEGNKAAKTAGWIVLGGLAALGALALIAAAAMTD